MQPRLILILFLIALPLPLLLRSQPLAERVTVFAPAIKIPHFMSLHGDTRQDDYFWMRERDTKPVLDYLRQENERTEAALAPVAALEKKLYAEMRARVKEDDRSVPVREHGYWYYWRFDQGGEYPVHARRKGTMEAREEIFLDENVAAKGHSYYEVGDVQISPDQNLVAFAVDTVGRRIYDIHFRDLGTGRDLDDKIESVSDQVVWAADNRTIFYVRQDPETLRSYQLYRYELGSNKPELVYEEKDSTYNVGVSLTKTERFILLEISKRDSSEIRVLDAAQPKGDFRIFLPREAKHEYSIEDGGDRFFILSDWHAPNFRLMEAPHGAHSKNEWREVVAHDSSTLIEGFDVYSKHFVLSERQGGLPRLAVYPRETLEVNYLKFPDDVFEVDNNPLPEFENTAVRFHYQSLVQPPSVYEEDVFSGIRGLLKTREVPGYDPSRYETKRLWAKAADGTEVPISVLRKKGAIQAGPALLYAYGSYGITMGAEFRSSVFSLIDRGFAYAIAHVRGGSEMGRAWYEAGRLKHKMNTFTDFTSAAEKLIADGYTTSDHLHIMGGSAGGLLVGAVLNLRPELFKSAVAAVPFVDVLTTMLDETIPLTTGEYNEWGDPRIPEQYGWMRRYSPYDNVAKKAYPSLLVTTGYHDSQVQYWEPAKWVAKLRELKTDQNLLLMHTELEAGHSGASGRFEALKTLAKEYAFILFIESIVN